MKCPKCGLGRTLADRVCRRCKYFFEEDRFIALEPPRNLTDVPPIPKWFIFMASVIPGLGHLLSGRVARGLILFSITILLGALSIANFDTTIGRALFGLAVSAHAFSIFDLTTWSASPDAACRAVAMGGILAGVTVTYWPLLTWIADRTIRPGLGSRDRWYGVAAPAAEQIAMMLFLFVAFVIATVWLRGRFGRGASR